MIFVNLIYYMLDASLRTFELLQIFKCSTDMGKTSTEAWNYSLVMHATQPAGGLLLSDQKHFAI